MAASATKLVAIGNSQGIRIPKRLIRRHRLTSAVVLEERPEGLLLRPTRKTKLSWDETYRAMAQEQEDWSDLDVLETEDLA